MTSLHYKIDNTKSLFQELQTELGGTLTTQDKETIFQIDAQFGEGIMRTIELDNGISFLEFSLNLNQDLEIELDSQPKQMVNFVYCSKGKLAHNFEQADTTHSIERFQTCIVANITSTKHRIFLAKDTEIQSTILSVKTSNSDVGSDDISSSVKKLFIEDKNDNYVYVGSFNLNIADYVSQLRAITQDGIVRSLLINGLVNMMLALEIDQHKQEIENPILNNSSLTRKELELIRELTDEITAHPDLDYSIDNITRKIGLSAAKIQEGFKLTKGHTICEFTRHARLSKAEVLMTTTDLNVSEIVYSLGFTSRSYFSKIFKDRFNCTPSYYQKKIKLAVSA